MISLKEELNEAKNSTLNKDIWDDSNELIPAVKKKLFQRVYKFKEILLDDGVDFEIKDIVILGSNANYNYTRYSDIDLHIVADLSKYQDNISDLLTKLYNAYKTLFNNKYTPMINGHEVEIYVEKDSINANSNGIYSLFNGWLKEPIMDDIPDDVELEPELTQWLDRAKKLLNTSVGIVGDGEVLTESDFDYHTGTVSGDDAIDTTTSETSWARGHIPGDPSYDYNVNYKNQKGTIINLSPNEYYERCAAGFNTTVDRLKKSRDDGGIPELIDVIKVRKKKFPLPYINYTGRFSQEGLHRMYALGEIYGWDHKFPVLIIDYADKELHNRQEKERMEYYTNWDKDLLNRAVNSVIDDTYSGYSEFADALEEEIRYGSFYDFSIVDKGNIETLITDEKIKFGDLTDSKIFIEIPKSSISINMDADDSDDIDWDELDEDLFIFNL